MLDALRTMEAEQRPALASAFLAESCRLPAPLAKALVDVSRVGVEEQPEQQRTYLWAVDQATFEAATGGIPMSYLLVAEAIGPVPRHP